MIKVVSQEECEAHHAQMEEEIGAEPKAAEVLQVLQVLQVLPEADPKWEIQTSTSACGDFIFFFVLLQWVAVQPLGNLTTLLVC